VYVALALAGSLGATVFAACAEGTAIEETGAGAGAPTGPGGGGQGGGGIPPGEVGGPCETQDDCKQGTCTQVGDGKFCTIPCPPDCPDGTYCAIIEGDSICVPDTDRECAKCSSAADCKAPAHQCLEAPLGDKFCARDCTTIGSCPNGFTCVVGSEYPPAEGSGGGTDGGTDGGNDAGDAASDGAGGGGGKPSGPYKFCVPSGGLSCPCNDKRDGVTHACVHHNSFGKCVGTETCDGAMGSWQGCTATVPAAETCNGKDDNCDTMKDEGDANDLCAAEGPPPPHAGWACTAGQCALGLCEAGWAAYPPGPPSDGCTCPVEAGENNNNCAAATGAGSVSDTPGGFIDIIGTLSSANDVDFWQFQTVDTDEVTTNSYHVSIDFTSPMPNNEFQFDVIRGDVCSDAPTGPGTTLTSYDWCVDGTNGTEGEGVCSPTGPVHCNNNSSKYYLRVFRKMGATGTCTQYTIHVTAQGGDPCDFATKCM